MNDVGFKLRSGEASKPPRGAGVPLDVIILAVRALEFGAVLLAGMFAYLAWEDRIPSVAVEDYRRVIVAGAVLFAVMAEIVGGYDVDAQFSVRVAWRRQSTAWLSTVLFLITLGFLFKASEDFSRGWAVSWFVATIASVGGVRGLSIIWIRRLKRAGTFNSRVAIFGASTQGQRLARYIDSHDKLTISLVGFYDDRRDGRVPVNAAELPVHGNIGRLIDDIRAGHIDQVIVALPWSAEARIQQVVSRLAMTPVRIRLAPDLASFAFAHRPVVLLGELPVLTLFERPISGTDAIVKAIEDRMLAVLILLVMWPVLLACAIAVRLDSSGPILFRQPRVGFNDRPFNVLKFRTMYHDRSEVDDVHQARRGDPRVTRVGHFLRRTSLDELPQLFNVLRGDMSIVGPRPHAPSTRAGGRLFHEVVASYAARHKVKPGITGWAQVCGWRGETDTEEKLVKRLEHDLQYIENWSIWFDFYILLRTVIAVVAPRNAF